MQRCRRLRVVLRRPGEGKQYAAKKYRTLMSEHGLVGSMGRRGNPYNNAKAESFVRTLKVEAVYQTEYASFEEVMRLREALASMSVCLAFAPATITNSEVLLIDEWFLTGDADRVF
jgi:transposase InsO family protein